MKRIAAYTGKDDFTEFHMSKKSEMAGILTKWVRAIEDYYKAYQIVKPKQEKLEKIRAELQKMVDELTEMQNKFEKLSSALNELKV